LGTNLVTDQTSQWIFSLDGSNDADSCKGVPFWSFVDIVAHSGGQIPPKPYLWCVNRRFQAKHAKYLNFHIIKTTASVAIRFCTMIKAVGWAAGRASGL